MARTEFDVVVLGSGAAGLAAALAASSSGARVLVAEKSEWLGGTTAMSGGCAWIPCNRHMRAIGETDSFDDALQYLRAVAPPGWQAVEEPLWRAFLEAGPRMLDLVEQKTPVRFHVGLEPDPYLEAPGAKRRGRNVSPDPLRMARLGEWAARLRPSLMPYYAAYDELTDTHFFAQPTKGMLRFGPRILWRWLRDARAMGQALAGGMVIGCVESGCEVRTSSRARSLVMEGGRVAGVELEGAGGIETVRAGLGVVIATGGFEWDTELMARFHPGPCDWNASPDSNSGDGLRMAEAAGAKLDRMDQALIMGTVPMTYLGKPFARPAADYTLPHSMIVNARGRRFVNEVQVNVGLGLENPANLPAWRIYDAQFVRRYPHALPKGAFAHHVKRAGTLRELAAIIGIDADGLEDEAQKMTRFAREGHDADFGRGSFGWDPWRNGDPRVGPNSCLGAISEAPFVALPMKKSFLGTKGGPRTDARGRVQHRDGGEIQGLWCAGNAMANPIGSKAVGAGTTLGPCLAWGFLCGEDAAHG